MKTKILLLIGLLSTIISCNLKEEMTVETAYIDPLTLPQVLKYKFSRNGISNVDYLECSLIQDPLDIVYYRLSRAGISNKVLYNDLMNYYQNGIYQIKPEQEVVTSPLHQADREKVRQDIIEVINKIAEISGYQSNDPSSHRNRRAEAGRTGYIGYNIGDPNVAFVDEKGVVLSEVFQGMIMGAIYLDKILNYHLDERFFNNKTLRKNHENIVLPEGRNFTELEHHWDLAYGYFGFWRSLTQPEGIPALKDSEQKLFNAFVLGRMELSRYRYDDMKIQLKIIREELSKVVAIRIINYLSGANTIANLKEDTGSDAFNFLSKAYGLIYALQFTRKPDGKPYFTYNQVQNILNKMKKNEGFWDNIRLLADENIEGSVKNIAKKIAKPFSFTPEEVNR